MSERQAAAAWKGTVIPVPTEKETRCPDCNHLLFKGELSPGSRVELKCPRTGCKRIISIARM